MPLQSKGSIEGGGYGICLASVLFGCLVVLEAGGVCVLPPALRLPGAERRSQFDERPT